jgi:hypothetical protein
MREPLLDKLFTIYKFEFEGAEDKIKRIADRAMCMMVKALSMWHNMANKNKDGVKCTRRTRICSLHTIPKMNSRN